MTYTIFCSNSHLILSAARCAKCNWVRPPAGEVGKAVWAPFELGAGLGGPGRAVFAGLAAAQGIVVLPLRSAELVGLDLNSGVIRWRSMPPTGQMTRRLVADGTVRLLLSLADERPIEQAGAGQLAALDPLNGQLTTLWQPGSSQISPPALTDRLIVVRTPNELVALHRQSQPDPAWRIDLLIWWALQPIVLDDIVLVADGNPMLGKTYLCAYALEDGRFLWQLPTEGMLTHAPVRVGQIVFVRNGKKEIIGLDALKGDVLFRRKYGLIYSGLQANTQFVYLVVRGSAQAGEAGHYRLQALDALTNQVTWESLGVPGRTRQIHLMDEAVLLLGDDDGHLTACETTQGSILWEYTLGSDENPIHTELLVAGDFLVAGTYFGRVVALQVKSTPSWETPQEYLERSDFRLAADAFALAGDLGPAAELYAGQLNEPEKAILLYEQAGLWNEAGELAFKQQRYNDGRLFFEKAGNFEGQAQCLVQMGDALGAAAIYEQLNEPEQAGKFYEQGGDYFKAFQIYTRIGKIEAAIRAFRAMNQDLKVQRSLDMIHDLEKRGHLIEAGDIALEAGLWAIAAKLFNKANNSEREFTALGELVKKDLEVWSGERLAELARSMGKFSMEADIWGRLVAAKKISYPIKAAEAYERAARQAVQVSPGGEGEIANLFASAEKYYFEEGMEESAERCRSQWIYYGRLPQILVSGRIAKDFREGEFNQIQLVLHNVGRGVAHEVCTLLSGSRFDMDERSCTVKLRHLGPSQKIERNAILRPKKGEVGDTVPLQLEWSWLDSKGEGYHGFASQPVPVRSKDEAVKTGPPVIIHAQTYVQGTLIGHDQVTGDLIQGDQVAGDMVEGDQVQRGAQKGDRVEIRRGEGVRLQADDQAKGTTTPKPTDLCPNCHLPLALEAQFCNECGAKVNGK